MIDGGTFEAAQPDLFHRLATGVNKAIPGIHVSDKLPLVVPYPVLVFFVLAVVMGVLLNRMRFGRYIYAIGANEQATRFSGVDVEKIKILAYVLVGTLTGISRACCLASHTSNT